jgi:hypothetical protein
MSLGRPVLLPSNAGSAVGSFQEPDELDEGDGQRTDAGVTARTKPRGRHLSYPAPVESGNAGCYPPLAQLGIVGNRSSHQRRWDRPMALFAGFRRPPGIRQACRRSGRRALAAWPGSECPRPAILFGGQQPTPYELAERRGRARAHRRSGSLIPARQSWSHALSSFVNILDHPPRRPRRFERTDAAECGETGNQRDAKPYPRQLRRVTPARVRTEPALSSVPHL